VTGMSLEVPQNIGELSNYAFEEALGKVDRALADAPEDVRAAIGVIRLVSSVPRRAPWYGIPMDPDDSSVTVGVVLRNAFEALGDQIDYPTNRGLETRATHPFTQRNLPRWRAGKREYNEYLDHLTDPLGFEGRRLSDEQAAARRREITGYLRGEP
jgi:hypothetical protein